MPDHHEYCTGGFSPDDIVISGISGRFPDCDNVDEFLEAIMTQKNLQEETEIRFKRGALGLDIGSTLSMKDLEKFDHNFFGFSSSGADAADPAVRQLLEVSYEALVDAGYDPLTELRGRNIGVYTSLTHQDARDLILKQERVVPNSSHTSVLLRCMTANRCSHFFDFHGPSYTMDSACSTSLVALTAAVNDMLSGVVDAALVNGCQINLNPDLSKFFLYAGIMSLTKSCHPFDVRADGILRGEACTALFIQKASVARRAYATILNMRSASSGYVKEGVFKPSPDGEMRLFRNVIERSKLKPSDIQFIEMHGTGTHVGDPIEVEAVERVYCKDRKEPLYIGSVKSNVGHSEAASGQTSAIKVILAFETGVIPPNFDFRTPNPECEALVNGKMKVVVDPLPLASPYIPISSFGFGGSIVHGILKRNPIQYPAEPDCESIPRLVLYSATTESAVTFVFDYVRRHPELRKEFFALLNKIAYTPTLRKPCRGYALFQDEKSVVQVKSCLSERRQVWFVMTGMGCQWPGMGLEMMQIEVFAESMKKSAQVLKPLGIDLFEILAKDGELLSTHRRITPAFVSISAIQIALVDVLRALEIEPDGIIGHSTGELICAYADGCCTAEQTILSAYWRGMSIESSKLVDGVMAAVGMTWDEAVKRCPPGVYPACHNAEDSVTISGLKEPVEKFVAQLQQENIFARVVNAYGYAFHSEYVWPAADALREKLKTVINEGKPRSKRWVSTSYPECEWETDDCKLAGVEYFVHNLMSVVRFSDALKKIPSDAVTIEIGPHFLLQSILKRGIGSGSSNIGLMKRNDTNNIGFFLESLGKLYQEGVDPRMENLYKPVKFPVPRGTPRICNLIQWDHSRAFYVPKWEPFYRPYNQLFHPESEDSYLLDHFIDGRSLFPATGYLYLAWKALSHMKDQLMEKTNVQITDFKIHRAVPLGAKPVFFSVTIFEGTGTFEIVEGKATVASGSVCELAKNAESPSVHNFDKDSKPFIPGADIYSEMKIHGYEYGPEFRRLAEVNVDGTEGFVEWNDKWIPFLDALLLFYMFGGKYGSAFVLPTGIRSVKIDASVLRSAVEHREKNLPGLPVTFNMETETCRTVGVEIVGLDVEVAPHHMRSDECMYEEYKFIPYMHTYEVTERKGELDKYLSVCDHLIAGIKDKLLNEGQQKYSSNTDPYLKEILSDFSEANTLLWTLKTFVDIDNISEKERKNIFSSYVRNMSKDFTNSLLVNEYCLRHMFDIVTENSFKKLSVLEINENSRIILPTITDTVEKFSFLKFKSKILISENRNDIEKNKLSDCGIQLYSPSSLKSVVKDRSQSIVIASSCYGTYKDVEALIDLLSTTVEENGFVMLFHKCIGLMQEETLAFLCGETLKIIPCAVLEKLFLERDLVVVSKISDGLCGNLYLLRRIVHKNSPGKVIKMSESSTWFEVLKSTVCGTDDLVWVVSEDSPTSGIIGMINCLRHEPGGNRIRCLFAPSGVTQNSSGVSFSLTDPIFKDIIRKDLVMNVYKGGKWGSFRHIRINKEQKPVAVDHSFFTMKRTGDLSSFYWRESSLKYNPPGAQDIIHIYYSALNFKDVMLASGKIYVPTQGEGLDGSLLGLEYAGRNKYGERIAGFCEARGLATAAQWIPEFTFPIPDHWSMEEAVTVPVVYATCYYGLIFRARLQPGESILIHSGTGGIGMAAINIALSMNCEVFTTVGTEEKRSFLLKNFPRIKPENIGCSRNTSFESMIMKRTNKKGVNVVLNSLAGELLQASVRCVADFGRFVEIGKFDLTLDHKLGLKFFLRDVSFHGVCLEKMFINPGKFKHFKTFLMDGIQKGFVKPLNRTVFNRDEVGKAFRYMGKGVHMGKVIIKIRDEEKEKICAPKALRLPAIPVTYFYPYKVYIVVGGLGGFGIEVANWLIQKRAKNIVLTSRFGARTPYHHFCLKRWHNNGINVIVSTKDVSVESEAAELLKQAAAIGPVGGIFNSAVVLKDSFLENMDYDSFKAVCAPKADATEHLDVLSRKLCPELDHFVCFSSISCGRGNAGQMNYGYANSVMERICEKRQTDGLPGVAIQWGIIGEVGVVHRHMGDDAMIAGVGPQRVKSCLEILNVSCLQKKPVVSSYAIIETSRKKGKDVNALQQLAKIFGLKDESEFNSVKSLSEMGVDSIMGTEIKLLLETACNANFSMQELQEMKIDDIKALLAKAEEAQKDAGELEQASAAPVSALNIRVPKPHFHEQEVVPLNEGKSGTPVFLLDIDCGDVFEISVLGKAVDRPLFGLLMSKNAPVSDLRSLALWYLEVLRKVTRQKVHLIARSTSSVLGVEMLLRSQKTESNILTFTMIDGYTTLSKTLNKGPEVSEADLILEFMEEHIPSGLKKLKDELSQTSNFEQQVKTAAQKFMKNSAETVDQLELSEIIRLHVVKTKTIRNHVFERKLTEDILVIEDSMKLLANDIAEAKTLLSQITSGSIYIKRIPDASVLNDENVHKIASLLSALF